MRVEYRENEKYTVKGEYKISVVIPCYNVENYLEEAVESVLSQTIGFLQNIQLILVNDGSKDHTAEICVRYEEKYSENIIYVSQENAGVSEARNHGYRFAVGKYINFLDGDDKWEEDAFERLYAYMEEHADIMLTCGRMRLFDADDRWHPLDAKFDKGGCVIDISARPEDTLLHITSSFIRREAIGDLRFVPGLRIGEDALFVNSLILKYGKFGALRDAVHMYRRRRDESSAVQGKHLKKDWYLVSPKEFYGRLVEQSKKYYDCVVQYIQALLFYDIGYRLHTTIPEGVLTEEEKGKYFESLHEYIALIDDEIIMKSRNHCQEIRLHMLEFKNDRQLMKDDWVSEEGKLAYYTGIYAASTLNMNSTFVFSIIEYDEKTKSVCVSGKIRNLVFDLFGKDISIYLDVNNGARTIPVQLTRFVHDEFAFLKDNRPLYTQVEAVIPLRGKRFSVRPFANIGEMKFPLGFCLGKFARISEFTASYAVMGRYILYKEGDFLWFEKPKYLKLGRLLHERRYQHSILVREERRPLAEERRKTIRYGLLHKKKIWLISDREFVANDNGEHFFRYLNGEGKKLIPGIRPIFVISENCPDYKRMQQYGEVVSYESEKYRILFLNADKIISSSGNDMVFNAYGKKRRWMADLYRFQFVFLQHGIIKDDMSGWLRRMNKNISMFVTSVKGEYDSIVNGNYGYSEKQVKMVGLARFDNLLKLPYKKEKRILILPTWRNSIKESFDTVTSESIYFDGFKDTAYFKFYNDLINDPRLLDCMRRHGYTGVFGLHPVHAKQAVDYQGNDVITVHSGYLDYQKEFARNSMMITDYSSTVMDFAYLKKPVVYAQFDKEEFFASHTYTEGYFDYERDGFGPVCYDLESTVDAMIRMMEKDCKLEPQYEERINSFFAYTDDQNCRRTVEAILNL